MKILKVVELFAGTQSCSKVARELGHKTWTTDWDSSFNCDLTGNILNEEIQDQIMEQVKDCDMVWMSPECTKWSLSAGNTYWTKYRMPKRDDVYDSIKMMLFCRFVADYCIKNNKIFFIENPNGRAVWILDNQYLKRCWYCQYGDTRAKPTNIWTNLENWTPKTCHNGNKDCHHESAPRGSRTGTQGLKGSVDRSRIPAKLFEEIFEKMTCATKRGVSELKLSKAQSPNISLKNNSNELSQISSNDETSPNPNIQRLHPNLNFNSTSN